MIKSSKRKKASKKETVLDRFLRYVRIDTTSDPDSGQFPSSAQQWDLLRLLEKELRDLGASEVTLTDYGVLMATIPATTRRQGVPTVAFFAHVDTSPAFPGKNVKPIVHRKWSGKKIVLPDDRSQVIDPTVYPDMRQYVGKDLVTASGKTLLGADDKSGVAIIMTMAQHLLANPHLEHGKIRICFNPDEEIGDGVTKLDLKQLGADVAYTLDSEHAGEVDWETFSADSAEVTIEGVSTHPGDARSKRMVNALKLAARLINALPVEFASPETTDVRQGFIHPTDIDGNAAKVRIKFILRDHDDGLLKAKGDMLRGLVRGLQAAEPRAKFQVKFESTYRNMGNWLRKNMLPVDLAYEAMRNVGLTPRSVPVRGGTDGSRLTERGLPTPNLFTGQHNLHGPREYICVQVMEESVKALVELASLWSKKGAGYRRKKA